MRKLLIFIGMFLMFFIISCATCNLQAQENRMKLLSNAFSHGQAIPQDFTCQGKDQSPPLSWTGTPPNTKSLALIMEDPDAAINFVHWIAWNIDPKTSQLPENSSAKTPQSVFVQGTHSAQKIGYMGPCPPQGTHRYFFRLFALDTLLNLPPTSNKEALKKAMEGHIIAQAELMGTFIKAQ